MTRVRKTVAPLGVRVLQGVGTGCAVLLMLLGVAVLVGWTTGSVRLMTVLPGYASMKAMTAVAFCLSGGSLLLSMHGSRWGRRVAVLLGCAVLALGVTAGLEYRLHVSFGIDQWPFADVAQNPFPGRMARVTAMLFAMSGAGLVLLAGGRTQRILSQVAALGVLATAFTGVVGFLYGVRLLYGGNGQEGYFSMALHTGVGFLVLGVGIVAADRNSRLFAVMTARESGGMLARRLIAATVVVPLGLGYILLAPETEVRGAGLGMALFAVTATVVSAGVLLGLALYLNRAERQRTATSEALRQSAEKVARSERDLRLVTDRLPLLISYFDLQGQFLWVNRTYEEWFGRPLRELVGHTIRELVGEAYWVSTAEYRQRALRGETVSFESVYPTVRGERRVQVTYAADTGGGGAGRGYACMVLDVEEQKRAEEALRQTEKLAVVGRLASSIAHEINNPLEAVTNLLYLVGMDTAGQEPVSGYVAQAQAELGRVTQIVVQTLRFHRQSSGATVCRMDALLNEVLVLYGGRLAGAGIEVNRRFRTERGVNCREGEVRQVVANLIGNAIDAMGGGGGRMLVRTREERGGVAMTVADTGHGMPPAVRATLFQPFHTTKGEKGSGLGLWVSKEIVDRHGGTMRVRSKAGCGTVFRVWLPG